MKDQIQWAWNTGLTLTMKKLFNMVVFILGVHIYDADLSEQSNKIARHWLICAMDKLNFSHRHEYILKKSEKCKYLSVKVADRMWCTFVDAKSNAIVNCEKKFSSMNFEEIIAKT